jgi:hypothetical protein
MNFYNFHNNETYHFFVWLTESGTVDLSKLIRQAFDAVEGDPWYEMGDDISRVQLGGILQNLLEEYMIDFDADLDEAAIEDLWKDDSPSNTRCLFLPIFSLALSRIDYLSVAEAILIQHGKWNPEKHLPELQEPVESDE